MKKIISLLLVLILVFSIPSVALAADTDSETVKKAYYDYLCSYYDYGAFDADKISYTDCGSYNGYQVLWFEDSYPSNYSEMGIYAGQYFFEGSIKIFPTDEYNFIEPMLAYKEQKIYRISSLVYKGELSEQDLAELNLYVKYTSKGVDAYCDSSLNYVLSDRPDGSVKILEYCAQSGNGIITIPDEIDGRTVSAIGPNFILNPINSNYIYVPASVTEIDKKAFMYKRFSVPFVSCIYGESGSYAQQFAKENGFGFLALGEFVDVPKNAWYYDSVRFCYDNGIIKGKSITNFCPTENIERQDFVLMLARMNDAELDSIDTSILKNKFSDAGVYSYYAGALAWALENNIINGYENGKFGVGDPITREQIMTILYRFYCSGKSVGAGSTFNSFSDKDKVSGFAKDGVLWCLSTKIISGKSDKILAPLDKASRAEAATVFMRLINYINGGESVTPSSETAVWVNYTDNKRVYENSLNSEIVSKPHTEGSVRHYPVFKFDSKQDIESFRESYSDILSFDAHYAGGVSFNEAVAEYNDKFFSDKSVICVYVIAGSGAFRHGVKEISVNDSSCCVYVERINNPQVYTDDMAGWFILIDIDKADIANCKEFDSVDLGYLGE